MRAPTCQTWADGGPPAATCAATRASSPDPGATAAPRAFSTAAPGAQGGDGPAPARLRLAQILSPAFPIGTFAWSQGLEWAMDRGQVNAQNLGVWIADLLAHGSLWTDSVLLACALRPGADLDALDDLARAACTASERLAETVEQGAALGATAAALTEAPSPPPLALPVAMGRACAGMPLPAAEIIAAFLQAQAAAPISTAVRFLPLGPIEGQRLLAGLHPAIIAAAARAAEAGPEALFTAAWGADIAAMRHETMTVRIFRS